MREAMRGTVRGHTIELEQPPNLPEGSPVIVRIERLNDSAQEDLKQSVLALFGAWKDDPSIERVFAQIAEERNSHHGREVPTL